MRFDFGFAVWVVRGLLWVLIIAAFDSGTFDLCVYWLYWCFDWIEVGFVNFRCVFGGFMVW